MKYYNITVNGVAYSVSVEETAAGAAPVAAAPVAAPAAPAAPKAPAAAPAAPAGAAGAVAVFCLHQRSKQQKDAFAQTFLRPAVAKLLPGVRVAAFDVLVVDAVVAGNDVVCIEYTAHLVVHL